MISSFTCRHNDHGHTFQADQESSELTIAQNLSSYDQFDVNFTTDALINQIDYFYDHIVIIYDLNTA